MKLSTLISISAVALFYFGSSLANDRKLRLPDFVTCERNNVTSWQGQVSDYQRNDGNVKLTVATNYDTEEVLALHLGSEEELALLYRLNGQPFLATDWEKLEQQNGKLKESTGIIVWVCEDNQTPPILDWKTTQ